MTACISRWVGCAALAVSLGVWTNASAADDEDDATASPFQAGFAERDITPEIGSERPGGYGKGFHRSLHDPCKVRASVFDDGQRRVAIVGLDALFIYGPSVKRARAAIHEKCGIPQDAILISASHSHSSGPMGMIQPGQFDHASELVQTLAYEKSSAADPDYLRRVEQAIVDAVVEADAKRAKVEAGVGSGVEDRVAFNRRFRMKNGLSFSHPGQGNPDIIEPAGPIDPEVGVIGAWGADGKLIGCIVNFSCHATTSPGGISANYIFWLEKVIRGTFGDEVIVVFLPGACGDVTQVDNLNPYANRASERWAEFVGASVGAEAVKVLLAMPRGTLTPVGAANRVITFGRRIPSPERVAKCLEMVKKTPAEVGAVQWTFAKEIVMLDALIAENETVVSEVQAVQVGPAVFISNPAEYFCQFGLDIKAGCEFPFTFPVEMANDCVGYVPTEEALGEHGGGYETRLTAYSNLEPTAGRKMLEVGLELAGGMTPGAVPVPPPARPFGGAGWSYGSVPPELE